MLWELSKMEQRCDAVLGVIRDGYPAQILPPDRHEDAVRLTARTQTTSSSSDFSFNN